MDTLSTPAFAGAPRARTSHVRSSSLSKAGAASAHEATRRPSARSGPPSQESISSVLSAASSSHAHRSQAHASDTSQLTIYSDSTSPASSGPSNAHAPEGGRSRVDISRARTPEMSHANGHGEGDYAVTSPMSIASPIAPGSAKRTASGHVKNASSVSSMSGWSNVGSMRPRAESSSSTGSRAGELAASLKNRLGYAMAKVQHGWEHKNITEVERLAAQRMSPNRHSISSIDYNRAAWTNGSAHHAMQEPHDHSGWQGHDSPPSKRHSANLASLMAASRDPHGGVTRLQPAADIHSPASQRHRRQPSLGQSGPYSSMMSPPRTPVHEASRRPGMLRTETQTAEAERDALQALFQLGSPQASQNSQQPPRRDPSQESSSQASPQRSDCGATPRRVTFARSHSDLSADSDISAAAALDGREHVMAEA